ncbi:hypothetical protein BDN70DRAFT_879632 [Pholiota conissans]|uniref:BTB domain-containing protein n=1 Tax=Pholiota conissans TaxID=109636 RepID=A0A9P5Z2R7_9AGAR|nr:hypothetical protein BDN70DRAFT_879632 [Pholiota conissans]
MPGPSATDIQTHLYNSFLHASTYDVALRVSGTWSAIYKLHRVVLIQSGFFRSLFTSGFAESSVRLVNLRNGTDEITVVFDDRNITRAAFEVCISRLYGGGPPLYISPNLIPTTTHPFLPPFSDAPDVDVIPAGNHPATPRFLISLLATSIYLSIPSVASQALSLILRTVGSATVLLYLDFACGRSRFHDYNAEFDEPEAAVGLENVAQSLDEEISLAGDYPQSVAGTEGFKSQSPDPDVKEEGPPIPQLNPPSGIIGSEYDDSTQDISTHYYGSISDKIGEACACWLTRWAVDVLRLEEQDNNAIKSQHDCRTRSKSLSCVDSKISISTTSLMLTSKRKNMPVIFRAGGLSANWIAAIVSADTLFLKNERARYNFAQSVVELRRKGGINEREEKVWTTMFEQGIYYNNMTFEDLLSISEDVSPTTNQPYVSQSVLHASHWTQSTLRQHVMQRYNQPSTSVPVSSSPPSSTRDKELGITCTTTDIQLKIAEADRRHGGGFNPERTKVYFPIFGDSSLRIGDSGLNVTPAPNGTSISMEDLFNLSQSPNHKQQSKPIDQTPSNHIPTNETAFFGIVASRFPAQACIKADPNSKCRWTQFPPYRFSVEFWDVDLLKEKSRLHSQTIWHAGSLFNVYVQLVRKKGQAQLGIYLHRQSNVDPIPASSTPSMLSQPQSGAADENLSPSLERLGHGRQPSLPSLLSITHPAPSNPHFSPSIYPLTRTTTPSATQNNVRSVSPPSPSSSPSTSPLAFGSSPATSTTMAPQQAYRDPRPAVSAYFSISCASATGSSQTRFSSSPDIFSVSQSWGWKSSTLRTEDFVEVGNQLLPHNMARGEEVSLRATVILGLV